MASMSKSTPAILVRLPVKSLVRFRSVSKSWATLITRSNFVMRHCSRENEGINTLSSLRILYAANPLQYVDFERLLSHEEGDSLVASRILPLAHVPREQTLVGSCNGLICLLKPYGCFFLWNPSTREINTLPTLETLMDLNTMFYGFGYDSTNQDYKIVCGSKSAVSGSTSPDLRTTIISIFTLKSGSWRTSIVEDLNFADFVEQGCLSNGALHWVENRYEKGVAYINLKARIIVFDLQREKFLEMGQLSDIINAQWVSYVSIQAAGDYIYLTYKNYSSSRMFTVSKMKEYKVEQSWDLEIDQDREFYLPRVMYMLEKDGVLMRFLLTLGHNDLVLYDPKEKKSRTIFWSNYKFDLVESPALFRETLISPVIGDGA